MNNNSLDQGDSRAVNISGLGETIVSSITSIETNSSSEAGASNETNMKSEELLGNLTEPSLKNKLFYIDEASLCNIMGIKDLKLKLSPNLNIIVGENSSGKTAFLKSLYSVLSGYIEAIGENTITQRKLQECIEVKIKNVFRPNDLKIGNIVKKGEKKATISLVFNDSNNITIDFGNSATEHVNLSVTPRISFSSNLVYIPPKEMISVENFTSLYDKYHISFEEMYNDLAKKLDLPKVKKLSDDSQKVISSLIDLIGGDIEFENGIFFFKAKNSMNKYEMGLLSEGYRKIVTLIFLIANGSLSKGSILFWDEPEANINPKLLGKLAEAIMKISSFGVQVFISTHNYFLSNEFGLQAKYVNNGVSFNFISLYFEDDTIKAETSEDLFTIKNNPIIDEFDRLYDHEIELKRKFFQCQK